MRVLDIYSIVWILATCNVFIIYVCVCRYVCTYVRMCVYVCIYDCTHVCLLVGMYVYMYVRTYVCMYVCMYDRIFYVNRSTIISMLFTLSSLFTCYIYYVSLWAKVGRPLY